MPPRASRARSEVHQHSIVAALSVAALAVAALVAGCSSKPHRPQAAPPTAAITTTLPAPSTTQPDSTDPAVVPILNDLLHQWDRGLTALLQAPQDSLASRDAKGWQILLRAFSTDSPYVTDLPGLLQGYADRGIANRRGPSGVGQSSILVNRTDRPSPDLVRFVWCAFDDSVSYATSTNAVVDDNAVSMSGWGEAHRIDGSWRLYRLRLLMQKQLPAGSVTDCPQSSERRAT